MAELWRSMLNSAIVLLFAGGMVYNGFIWTGFLIAASLALSWNYLTMRFRQVSNGWREIALEKDPNR